MFDLATSGFTAFSRFGRVLSQRKIAKDPLSGIADGENVTFFTNYSPILTSGSLGVYVKGIAQSGSADYDTGEVTLDFPPVTQPAATYTFTPYTATQILQFLIWGFDEMEMRWLRNWKLVDVSGNPADETSTNLYVSDSAGADPTCGAFIFSQSRVQVAFLMLCTEYRYYLTQQGEASISDFLFREGVRGMTVDKTDRSLNINRVIANLEERLKLALERAMEQYYPGGEQYGGYTSNPVTLEYATGFEWQSASKEADYRSQLGFHVSYRPLVTGYYP